MNTNEDTSDRGELERQDEQPQPAAIFSEDLTVPFVFGLGLSGDDASPAASSESESK